MGSNKGDRQCEKGFNLFAVTSKKEEKTFDHKTTVFQFMHSNQGWVFQVSGIVRKSTGVLSKSKANEPILAPISSPGVADLPVPGSLVRENPDSLDTMINLFSADFHDTPGVTVPGGSVDTNREGASAGHIGGHVVLSPHSGEAILSGNYFAHIIFAPVTDASVRSVWVGGFFLLPSKFFDISVGSLSISSPASSRAGITANNLLWTEFISGTKDPHNIALELFGS